MPDSESNDDVGDRDPLLDIPISNTFAAFKLQIERESNDDTINWFQAVVHLLKGNIGSGLLSLPLAFSHAGTLVGPLAMSILCFISLVCINLLLHCGQYMCLRNENLVLDYGNVCSAVFKHSTIRIVRRYSHWGRYIVNFLLIITQLGFCGSYLIFIATTFQKFMQDNSTLFHDVQLSEDWLLIASIFPVLLLCSVRNLSKLSIFTFSANVVLGFAIFYITTDFLSLSKIPSRFRKLEKFCGFQKLPIFFGQAIFAVEGIGLVFPLQKKMRSRSQFKYVINFGLLIVFFLFIIFGTLGFLRYGHHVLTPVSLNLPKGEILAEITKLSLVFVMFITYALQFYVPIDILLPQVHRTFSEWGNASYREYTFRFILVIITYFAAFTVPNLDNFIALVGSLGSSFLAIILPAVLHIFTVFMDEDRSFLYYFAWCIFDSFLILFGVAGTITGTLTSVQSILHQS